MARQKSSFHIAAPWLALLPALAHAQTPTNALRINQLGYETGQPAQAFFISTTKNPAATFTLTNAAGQTITAARIGPTTGKWGAFFVYPLAFTPPADGAYTLTVTNNSPLAAVQITAAAPATLYRAALANALTFYQTERDGPNFIPNALRNAPAHLNDAEATVFLTPPVTRSDLIRGPLTPAGEIINAAGGWWDAGDYLKFVETHSYTTAMLLTGLRDFPAQIGPGSPADFTAEAKFGLDFLLNMYNPATRTLYYQVGTGIDFQGQNLLSDHDLWRLPQRDDTYGGADPSAIYIRNRPVFRAAAPGAPISPNLAGRLAAAFALCFLDYRTSDLPYARKCLRAATSVFDQADTAPAALLTALPYDFYPETEWRDDLEWGATELNLALALGGAALPAHLPHNAAYYLNQAAAWAHAYITGPNDAADTLNLYDVSGLAHYDLIRAIQLAANPPGLPVTTADLQADLLRALTRATAQAASDPFGFGFPWAAYDTTSHGAGLAIMASEAATLTNAAWPARSAAWLGNILGENIWGLSLLVGDGVNFPACLQHQVANIAGSLSGAGLVLAGAAVEGPNATGALARGRLAGMRPCPADHQDVYKQFTGRGARFRDNVQNYANTEPAIDLTAATPLAFAWRIAAAPVPLH